jgi:hypothetical protein
LCVSQIAFRSATNGLSSAARNGICGAGKTLAATIVPEGKENHPAREICALKASCCVRFDRFHGRLRSGPDEAGRHEERPDEARNSEEGPEKQEDRQERCHEERQHKKQQHEEGRE